MKLLIYIFANSHGYFMCVYITDSYIRNGPAAGLFPQSDEESASFTVTAHLLLHRG